MVITEKQLINCIKKSLKEMYDIPYNDLVSLYSSMDDEPDLYDPDYEENQEVLKRHMKRLPKNIEQEIERELNNPSKFKPEEEEDFDPSQEHIDIDLDGLDENLCESIVRKTIKEALKKKLNENYPPGARYDKNAPWNENSYEIIVECLATYYNENNEEKKVQYNVEVTVSNALDFYDKEDMKYLKTLIDDSGEIPLELSDGFGLSDYEITDFNYK